MTTSPTAVVFDLGKVLVDFDYGIAARKIAARAKISAEELARCISQSPLFVQYEKGWLSSEAFFRQVSALTGFAGDLAEFAAFFGDIFVPIEPMVQLHETLRQRRIPTFIFSNTNELAVRQMRQNFPFFSRFDGHILSYEHGAMKPEPALYEVVEREAGRKGGELLYLDDRPENIAAGAARGWHVILQESPEKSRAAIARFGLLNHA